MPATCCSEDNFERLASLPIELVVALGREGKQYAQIDPSTHTRTAVMGPPSCRPIKAVQPTADAS